MGHFFRVTERNHTGMILMTELARVYQASAFISLREIAEKNHISVGYLEEIAFPLKQAGFIRGRQGPNGGYQLALSPEKITAYAVLSTLEGSLNLLPCLSSNTSCGMTHTCSSRPFWNILQTNIQSALQNTTLADMIHVSFLSYDVSAPNLS